MAARKRGREGAEPAARKRMRGEPDGGGEEEDDKTDFAALADRYPELRPHVRRAEGGAACSLDFRSAPALVALTKCILHRDFGYAWDLPAGHLCPPVPNRKRYVRWLGSLLAGEKDVCGVDIGTGASLIYPLLCHGMYGWRMVATECDEAAAAHAAAIVGRNGLAGSVDVRRGHPPALLEGVLRAGECFTFCMANPPFFDSAAAAAGEGREAPPRRDQRARAITDSENSVKGGEVAYVGRLIEESLRLRGRVKWYTSMLGRKVSLKAIRKVVQSHADCMQLHDTEFTCGRTTRWLIAWRVKPAELSVSDSPRAASATPSGSSFGSTSAEAAE